MDIVEEIINELNDKTYKRAADIAKAVADEQERNEENIKSEKNSEYVKNDIAKKKHQAALFAEKRENQVVNREKQKYKESKKKKN